MNYFLRDGDYWRHNICSGAATVGEALVKPAQKTQQRSVQAKLISGNVTANTSEELTTACEISHFPKSRRPLQTRHTGGCFSL